MSTNVADFLRSEARKAGSLVALAGLFGISRQRLDDAMRGGFRIGFKSCLKFALETDRDAVDVLQSLGHADLADLLRRTTSGAKGQRLRPSQVDLLQLWERITPEERRAMQAILTRLASIPQKQGTKSRNP